MHLWSLSFFSAQKYYYGQLINALISATIGTSANTRQYSAAANIDN